MNCRERGFKNTDKKDLTMSSCGAVSLRFNLCSAECIIPIYECSILKNTPGMVCILSPFPSFLMQSAENILRAKWVVRYLGAKLGGPRRAHRRYRDCGSVWRVLFSPLSMDDKLRQRRKISKLLSQPVRMAKSRPW